LFAEILITGITLEFIHRKDEKITHLFFWIIIPILLFSIVRAANRYMFTILVPLSLYITFIARRVYTEPVKALVPTVLVLHSFIYLPLGFYAIY
jgi:hypothetical protein